MKGKKYIYAHKFEGMPKLTDLQLVEEELPPVKDGGKLCQKFDLNNYVLRDIDEETMFPLFRY